MKRKITIVTDPDCDEEVIIKCRTVTPEIMSLCNLIESGEGLYEKMTFKIRDLEYIISLSDVLFFESSDDKVAAHTKANMYYTDKTLRDLEKSLPPSFERISKSCLVNLDHITSLKKGLSGVCEIFLDGGIKKVYASRMYFKSFKERLNVFK